MKNIILLLLLCHVVFINSQSTVKKLKCRRRDYNAIPGFVLCHRANNITVVERKQLTKNLTIFNQEIDSIIPEIFNKFSPKTVAFRAGDKKSQFIREITYLNDSKKFDSTEVCINTPWSSWIDINTSFSEKIIDFDKVESSILNGSTLLKDGLTKSDWLNGICKIFPPIKGIFINDDNSTKIKSNALFSYKDVNFLQMELHEVDNLPLNIFNSLHKLKTLKMSCPKITSLPKTIFNNSKLLSYLSIHMRLTKLELGIFDGLFSLISLDLTQNQLETLPENIFKDLHGLEHLDLGFNLLTSIKADTLRHLTSLQTLLLNDNKISSIENNSLPTESITTIILKNNELTSDSIDLLNGIEKLEVLDLSANNISRILNNAFDRLKNLQVLDLGNNNVTEFESYALAGIWNINLTLPDAYYTNDATTTTIDTTTFDYTTTETTTTIDTTTMGEEQQTTFASNL